MHSFRAGNQAKSKVQGIFKNEFLDLGTRDRVGEQCGSTLPERCHKYNFVPFLGAWSGFVESSDNHFPRDLALSSHFKTLVSFRRANRVASCWAMSEIARVFVCIVFANSAL